MALKDGLAFGVFTRARQQAQHRWRKTRCSGRRRSVAGQQEVRATVQIGLGHACTAWDAAGRQCVA